MLIVLEKGMPFEKGTPRQVADHNLVNNLCCPFTFAKYDSESGIGHIVRCAHARVWGCDNWHLVGTILWNLHVFFEYIKVSEAATPRFFGIPLGSMAVNLQWQDRLHSPWVKRDAASSSSTQRWKTCWQQYWHMLLGITDILAQPSMPKLHLPGIPQY